MAFSWQADGVGTDQELLDLVNEAIARISKLGQRVELPDGVVVDEADLSDLLMMKRELEAAVAQAEGSILVNVRHRR